MERPEDRVARERDERHANEAMRRALEPRGGTKANLVGSRDYEPFKIYARSEGWRFGEQAGLAAAVAHTPSASSSA